MEIILTPSWNWLETKAAECRTSFDISSPFVGEALNDLMQKAPAGVAKTLITRTRLLDFASGASDLEAVSNAAKYGAKVLSLERLHAKVYVFDEQVALVTSANATFSGFRRNTECGIAITDTVITRALSIQVRSRFGVSPSPAIWDEQQLRSLAPAIERLKDSIPESLKIRVRQGEEEGNLELSVREAGSLLESTGGWTSLVFKNLAKVPEEFTAREIYEACRPDSARDYPDNQHPEAKVRQQLQVLRDLGFVHFYGNGTYRRLVRFTY